MKKIYFLFIFSFLSVISFAQVSITSLGTAYTQDFNTLANTGAANAITTLPTGWTFLETGTAANTTYAADAGSTATGNTYSYGTASSTDRALGTLLSGSLVSTIGVSFTNNTGSPITSIAVSYTGEEWRVGMTGRQDRLDFQYSIDATSLNTGTWTDDNTLDFSTPTTTTGGAQNGNAAANRTALTHTIIGLNIAAGSTFWLRWTDFNAAGADDGLAVDDFSATFNGASLPTCTAPPDIATNLLFTNVTTNSVSGSFSPATANGYLIIRSTASVLSAFPTDGVAYTAGSALGGGIVVAAGTGTTFTDNGLTAATQYYYFVLPYNDQSCAGGPVYNDTYPQPNDVTTSSITGCTTPAPPTALNLSSTNTFITGSFTGSGASKYLVVVSTASTLSASPANGTVYIPNQAFGNGTVVSYGASLSFTAAGLTPNTQYYLFVFAANDACNGEPFYSTSLNGNILTTNNSNGVPAGYYNAAAGLSCGNLKDALSNIITNGQATLSYGALDDTQIPVADTIRSDDGTHPIIWDIYTNNTAGPEPFEFNASQMPVGGFCGTTNPTTPGVCWNKEHTFPKSWFGSQLPTYADLFIVRPTDISVNSARMNVPYATVGGATTYTFPASPASYPGVPTLDKIGASTSPGVSGTAFEPSDGVKGDIARAYFYILTRYQNNLSGWVAAYGGTTAIGTVVDGTTGGGTYPSFKLPYLTMMYNWHVADPVDARESNYNDLVFSQQNNRNPYIDHPEYVAQVFQCTGVIPVTLIDFTAQKNNDNVWLKWYATRETSFSRYDVERSTDGNSFNKIGEVTGQNLANYSFIDNNLPKNAVVYYRLKMIDLDGKFRYSKIVSVRLNNNFSNAIVYPNPTAGALHIKLLDALQANSDLIITDITGRIVKKQSAGDNAFSIDADVNNLPAGRYFIKIINSRQVINESFVVLK